MKLKEFQKQLSKNKLDGALLFSKDPNFFYFVQGAVDNGMILIPKKGRPFLFFNKLEDVKTKFKKIVYENAFEDLKAVLKQKKIFNLGINEFAVTVRNKKRLSKIVKTKDISEVLSYLRVTKTKEEITNIRRACFLTQKILKKLIRNFGYFNKEDEIREFIKIEAIKMGCELSFNPIVALGRNAVKPHYNGNERLRKGFLLIDLGLKYKGYCADMTRMFYLGKPSKKDLDKYKSLLNLQKAAVDMVKSGTRVKGMEDYVRSKLGKDDKYFIHSLGHGVGIEIHEFPRVSSKSDDVLREGMVITVEPGIYKKQGMRIEDVILVTKKGKKILTNYPKQLLIIPKF